MSQKTFVFQITSLPNHDGYDLKITSVVGADLVKIDYKTGCATLSTSKQTEEVVILYELSPHNPTPPTEASITTDQDDNKDHEDGSTSATVESLKMVIAIKNQGNDLIFHTSETSSGAYIASPIGVRTMDFVASNCTGTTDNSTSSSRRLRNHKEHDMTLTIGDQLSYKCSGCKELGFGDRYKCVHEECSHILHPDCRFYNENATHEFLNGSTFNFFEQHFGGKHRYCDACGIDIKGYFYHCNKTNKDLHPCCLNLQKTVQVGEMKFQLYEKLTSKCFYCKSKKKHSKGKYWCYSSESQDLQCHVSCMKNALLKCWKDESIMASVKRKVNDLLEWAKMLLKKITQFLKSDKVCLEKIIRKLIKAKKLLDKIIPGLELVKKQLEKTTTPFLQFAVYLEIITEVLKTISCVLEVALSTLSALSDDRVQCTHDNSSLIGGTIGDNFGAGTG